jgi:peroxiredoxin Q/BCP
VLKGFKEKFQLPFPLLSDPDRKVAGAYGVLKEKNLYGKKVMGIERSTFVIAPGGRIAREFRGVKAAGHAEEVLAALK